MDIVRTLCLFICLFAVSFFTLNYFIIFIWGDVSCTENGIFQLLALSLFYVLADYSSPKFARYSEME